MNGERKQDLSEIRRFFVPRAIRRSEESHEVKDATWEGTK
jgi:hypothetical protein